MKKLLLILLLILHTPARADSESLEPNANGDWEQWSLTGFATTWKCVADESDISYISSGFANDPDTSSVNLTNPGSIGAADVIDSVKFIVRGKKSSTSTVTTKIIFYDGTNFGEDSTFSMSTSWVYYETISTTAPDGGAWTLVDVNNLQCMVISTVGFLDTDYCSEIDCVVYFTEAAASYRRRISRQLMLMGE